jgi:hypothetical protein
LAGLTGVASALPIRQPPARCQRLLLLLHVHVGPFVAYDVAAGAGSRFLVVVQNGQG